MGMDVFGIAPSSSEGEYFRASVWSWRPIHELMMELCHDLLDAELLAAMSFNDGQGPGNGTTCTEMADRFEAWLDDNRAGCTLESSTLRVDGQGRFIDPKKLHDKPQQETYSPYRVDDEHLREWVTFLRHCGGFCVR